MGEGVVRMMIMDDMTAGLDDTNAVHLRIWLRIVQGYSSRPFNESTYRTGSQAGNCDFITDGSLASLDAHIWASNGIGARSTEAA